MKTIFRNGFERGAYIRTPRGLRARVPAWTWHDDVPLEVRQAPDGGLVVFEEGREEPLWMFERGSVLIEDHPRGCCCPECE